MSHRIACTLTALTLAGTWILALCGCSSHAEQTATVRMTPVHVEAATTGPATPPIVTNGTVANKDEMRLSFKVAGVIRSIAVDEGQTVHKGQRLAEIELTEINAQVEQLKALAEKAQRDLQRGERLYADQVISLEQLQDLRTQTAAQQAQLKSAEFNRGYSVITAPSDAVVLRKLLQERELVPAGQPVLILGARNRGYVVRAALSDRELVQLKLGDRAEVRLDAYPGQVLSGTVSEIGNAADEKSGLFPIEVRLDPVPLALASGLVAKLRIDSASSRAKTVIYVPVAALVEGDGDRASVFVIEAGRAVRRAVRIAFIHPSGVALASGVQAGEQVVTDGAPYLEQGDRVEVVQENAATRAVDTGQPATPAGGDAGRSETAVTAAGR